MVRREVEALGRHDVFFSYTMREVLDRSTITEQMLATLSGFFGLAAVLLTCIGVYGTMAYAVNRRVHEIAIRMAVGAEPADINRLVLRDAARIILPGAVAGMLAAAATTFASSMLFGLTPVDPLTFLTAAVLMIAVALLAAYLPAVRAARLAPMRALRHE